MKKTTLNNPCGAAYCSICETVFEYEKRDLFEGEVFCPSCSSRVTTFYGDLEKAKKKHTQASEYKQKKKLFT